MAYWICRPSLYSKEESIPVNYRDIVRYEIPIGMEIVDIDTENLQESLYNAFNNLGWKDGEKLGIKKTDKFSIKEDKSTFEIYVNGKFIATFCKDRELKKLINREYTYKDKQEKMSEKDLKLSVINNADAIAKALTRGRDVEIRKSASGISVAEISKKVVCK